MRDFYKLINKFNVVFRVYIALVTFINPSFPSTSAQETDALLEEEKFSKIISSEMPVEFSLLKESSEAERKESQKNSGNTDILLGENLNLDSSESDLLTTALTSYIRNYTIENQSVPEGLCARKTRLILKVLATIYGSTAGIPFISASCNAAQGIDILCGTFAAANVISYGGSTAWAALHITESLDPISAEEKVLRSGTSYRYTKHIVCNILALITSTPIIYPVYKYNSYKFLAIPAYLTTYIYSTLGYYLISDPDSSMRKLLLKLRPPNEIRKLEDSVKEKLISQLKHNGIHTILENDIQNSPFMNLSDMGTNKAVEEFLQRLLFSSNQINTFESPNSWKNGYPRLVVQTLSAIFPIGNSIVNYFKTYQGLSLIIDNDVANIILSGVTMVPLLTLELFATTSTAGNIFDIVYNKVTKRHSNNFTEKFYPKLRIIIPVVSVVIGGLSVAGDWYTAYDTIENSSLKSLAYTLPAMTVIANTIFESFSVTELLYDTIQYFSRFSKTTKGRIANQISRLEDLCSVISKSSSSKVYNFWESLKNIKIKN